MSQLFSIRPEDLTRLNAQQSVDLVRDMVCADAVASGIPMNTIDVPRRITVRDGGIDGSVDWKGHDSTYGLIKHGKTRYQVKSGGFELHDSKIRSILFTGDNRTLKDRIKHCLDDGGTLIIVFTSWDDPDSMEDRASNKFKEILAGVDQKYADADIEIWKQNTIINFLNNFPALRLSILASGDDPFYSHHDWSNLADMKTLAHLGREQDIFVKRLRDELSVNDKPVNIRILGEPGIGKTKLVLEATNTDYIRPLTVYVENPTVLEQKNFIHKISRIHKQNMVLIVDECSLQEQANIWNRLAHNSPKLRLVTIFNEPGEPIRSATRMEVPGIGPEEIGHIFTDYQITGSVASRWFDWCGGSPRAAHILGHNLRKNPDDLFRSPDTVPVWDRYIANQSSFGSDDFKNRRTILLWLSLFRKFGVGPKFGYEVKKIADIICCHTHMSVAFVYETIKTLRSMKILQGDTTLYITPKILHVYLWCQWWATYDDSLSPSIEEMRALPASTDGHDGLYRWYTDMFKYAKSSDTAKDVAKGLLGSEVFFDVSQD